MDLICAIATPSAQSAYSVGRKNDIPVIYTAVTDPVAAELANADGTPVGEVTGTSDKLPVEQQLEMIRAILPDAKKIGIMYTTSEVNSASTLAEYKEKPLTTVSRSLSPAFPPQQTFHSLLTAS